MRAHTMRNLRCVSVALFVCMALTACGRADEVKSDSSTESHEEPIETLSITQESDEEIASRTRDVAVLSSADTVEISAETASKILTERGFKVETLIVQGSSKLENGEIAKPSDSALTMVGWWVDSHDRVWALHVSSGSIFASRVWSGDDNSLMLVTEDDRVLIYNSDLGRLIRMATKELEAEGTQVVKVDKLDAEHLGSVEVSS